MTPPWYVKLEVDFDHATAVHHGKRPNWQFHPTGMSVATLQRSMCPRCEMSPDLCAEFGCPDPESRQP